MSKHILRVTARYNQMTGVESNELQPGQLANATLVSDDACFPVKEARRLCSTFTKWQRDPNTTTRYLYHEAGDQYQLAVDRMKLKKSQKST